MGRLRGHDDRLLHLQFGHRRRAENPGPARATRLFKAHSRPRMRYVLGKIVDGKTECVHRDPQGNVCTARKAGSLQFLTKENDAFAVVKRVRAHYWETRRFAKMHPGDPAGAHLRA